jgi:hypothetical protein
MFVREVSRRTDTRTAGLARVQAGDGCSRLSGSAVGGLYPPRAFFSESSTMFTASPPMVGTFLS